METTNETIVIISCGNRTPVGHRTGLTACHVRGGMAGIKRHPDFMDSYMNPVRLGTVDYLEDLYNHERLIELSKPALTETLLPLAEFEKLSGIPVIIGLPERRPGLAPQIDFVLERSLMESGTLPGVELSFDFLFQGHTSAFLALTKAREKLTSHPFCVIGGVDSYHEAVTIEWLEIEKKRLFCQDNKDGFVPGEAAGFCLLSTMETARHYKLDVLAKILSFSSAEEKNEFDSGKNSTGQGLSSAIHETLKVLPENLKIDQIYCSLNGESYNTLDYSYSILNIGKYIKDVGGYIAPFLSWGDIGAASGPVLISLATEAGRKNYAKGPINLITTSSLGRSRACALLELPVTEQTES